MAALGIASHLFPQIGTTVGRAVLGRWWQQSLLKRRGQQELAAARQVDA